jgi:plastocyanin
MTLRVSLLAVPLVLLAAGCGSSSKSSSSSPAPPATTSTAAKAPASSSGGGGTAVDMKNIAFSPKAVTVKVGQKITWTNQDSVDHNVTATAGASFHSSNFGQGGTYSFTPTKAGTIKYVCTIHPGMDATITVTG